MEKHFFEEDSRWSQGRIKRIGALTRVSAYIILVCGVIWIFVTAFQGLFFITGFISLFMAPAMYSLRLIRQQRLSRARIIIFACAVIYFMVVCIFLDGPDSNHPDPGQGHYWFIVLAVFFYFLLPDTRKVIRDTIPLLMMGIFLLLHFRILSYTPVIDVGNRTLIDRVTIVNAVLVLYVLTRQFAIDISRAENALVSSAGQLQGLIDNILPKKIAERLTKEKRTFAEFHQECSILFADIVGFTQWAAKHSPDEVADSLNDIYSRFDEAVENAGLIKIKTIGDCYMAASGIPDHRADHASALVHLAFKFQRIAADSGPFTFRIGIHSGAVVAGVIGKKNFSYDVWGDTVNIASRMESAGEAGRINISGATCSLLKGEFSCLLRDKLPSWGEDLPMIYFVEDQSNPGFTESVE